MDERNIRAVGEPCPYCNKGKIQHVGIDPLVINGKAVEPENIGICDPCHAKQYKAKYGVAR